MPKRLAITLLLLAMSAQARAQCLQKGLVENVAAKLHTAGVLKKDLTACKAWPYDPALTIVAFASVAVDSDEDVFEADMHVAVLRSGTGEIVASFGKPRAWESDAIRLRELSLDTARYQLAPGVRAFGVKAAFQADSRPNPYQEDTLSLFVVQGDRLHPLLEDLETRFHHGESDGFCTGEFETRESTISVSPRPNGRYADLVYATTTRAYTGKEVDGDCRETVTGRQSERTVFEFRDGAYAARRDRAR